LRASSPEGSKSIFLLHWATALSARCQRDKGVLTTRAASRRDDVRTLFHFWLTNWQCEMTHHATGHIDMARRTLVKAAAGSDKPEKEEVRIVSFP
jgi:hypothetical protein